MSLVSCIVLTLKILLLFHGVIQQLMEHPVILEQMICVFLEFVVRSVVIGLLILRHLKISVGSVVVMVITVLQLRYLHLLSHFLWMILIKFIFRVSSIKNLTYLMVTMNSQFYHLDLVTFLLKNLFHQKVLLQFQNLEQINSI